MIKISLSVVYEGINNYHIIYGWAPTIQELSKFLNAGNEMEVRHFLGVLQEYDRIKINGERTMRTIEIRYVDERSDRFIEDMEDVLTRTEKKVYEYLIRFITENAIAPTQEEIARAIGVNPETSRRTIKRHLVNMSEKGAIAIGLQKSNRAIHVIGVNAKTGKMQYKKL